MGRVLLVGRLALRDLRRRPAEAALLVLAIMAATTTLTLGLILRGIIDDPYQNTRDVTAGPDVVASVGPLPLGPADPSCPRLHCRAPSSVPADLAGLDALTDAPGVTDHSGPYPVIGAELEAQGVASRLHRGEDLGGAGVWVEGRDPARASVDQPQVTHGSWVRPGGAVVEAGLADALGVGEGDHITLNGRSFEVAGLAVTAAARPYPNVCLAPFCRQGAGVEFDGPLEDGAAVTINLEVPPPPVEPGLVWLIEADARGLAPAVEALSYVVHLRLADPTDAPAFVDRHAPTTPSGPVLESWQNIRAGHQGVVSSQQRVLQIGSRLLGLLAVASVSVLVGGRMAEQTRRVGLLKAVGGTPSLVAAVLLAEYMFVAMLAAAAGLGAGWLAAPLLTDAGTSLLGRAGPPSLTLATAGAVTALALAIAAVATTLPAIRAARTSTVQALVDAAHPPRRIPWLIAISARLPVPLLLGVRVAARRPRRVMLSTVSYLITVSGVVAALAAQATVEFDARLVGGSDPQAGPMTQALLVVTVMLVALAAVNAIFVTWATALDNKHSTALTRALGTTPDQVSSGLSAAQLVPAFAGAVLGIPGGLALFAAVSGDDAAIPPLWQLLAVVPVTMLVVAALTAIPARVGARRPTIETLQAELA